MPNDVVNLADTQAAEWESEFQSRILGYAKTCGFEFQYHIYDSRRSAAGYPDITLLNPAAGVGVLVAFKAAGGKLMAAQREWLLALNECDMDASLWMPSIEGAIVQWLYSPIGRAPSVDFWTDGAGAE